MQAGLIGLLLLLRGEIDDGFPFLYWRKRVISMESMEMREGAAPSSV